MPMSPQSDGVTRAGNDSGTCPGCGEIHRKVALPLVWRQVNLLEEAEQPHFVLLTT